jgi:hypothetical protein
MKIMREYSALPHIEKQTAKTLTVFEYKKIIWQ